MDYFSLFESCYLFNLINLITVDSVENVSQLTKELNWWEVVGGILAIPTTLIGLAYSYMLIHKTRMEVVKTKLETRKLELEIQEKEKKESRNKPDNSHLTKISFVQDPRIRSIFLRTIALFLILSFWNLVTLLFQVTVEGILFAVFDIYPDRFHWLEVISMNDVRYITSWVILKIPVFMYWILLVLIGWPIFRDTNELLGLRVKKYFSFSRSFDNK